MVKKYFRDALEELSGHGVVAVIGDDELSLSTELISPRWGEINVGLKRFTEYPSRHY